MIGRVSIATATIVTALTWLGLLAIHVVFPKVLPALFRPFVRPATGRVVIPIAVALLTLISMGFVFLYQLPYKTYIPDVEVRQRRLEHALATRLQRDAEGTARTRAATTSNV